jgi:hypothetical protein
MSPKTTCRWHVAIIAFALAIPGHSAVIANGGFEVGFSSWTRADQLGSEGTFSLQTGTVSPVNASPVPAPPGGTTAAMTDAQGPGSHLLYQDFTVTTAMPAAILVFDLFIGNRDTSFVAPNTLDFSTPALNQQARVDLLVGASAPFSLAAADLLMNLYQTKSGDPLVSGYTHISVDITSVINSHLNTPLRLRFAEVDNVFTQQLGVDNVDIVASAVPEPSTFLALVGLLCGTCLGRSSATPVTVRVRSGSSGLP